MPWQETGFNELEFDVDNEHHTMPHNIDIRHVPQPDPAGPPPQQSRRGRAPRGGGPRRRVQVTGESEETRRAIARSRAKMPSPMSVQDKEGLRDYLAERNQPIMEEIGREPVPRRGRRRRGAPKGPFVDFDRLAAEAGFEEAGDDDAE